MKFGCDADWTTSVTVVVCVRLPLVAVISGCEVAIGVVDAVWIVSVALLRLGGTTFEVVPSLSFQLAVAPLGRLLALRLTGPVNPLTLVTVTRVGRRLPLAHRLAAGDAAIEKSGLPPAASTA